MTQTEIFAAFGRVYCMFYAYNEPAAKYFSDEELIGLEGKGIKAYDKKGLKTLSTFIAEIQKYLGI